MIIIRVEIHRNLHLTTYNTTSTRDIKHYQEKKNITHELCNERSAHHSLSHHFTFI